MNHFCQRLIEATGYQGDPKLVQSNIRQAILNNNDDLVAPMFSNDDGTTIYRFRLPGHGILYTVAGKNGWPRTVMDKKMLKNRKFVRKRKNKPHPKGGLTKSHCRT